MVFQELDLIWLDLIVLVVGLALLMLVWDQNLVTMTILLQFVMLVTLELQLIILVLPLIS